MPQPAELAEEYPSPRLDALLDELRSPSTVMTWLAALGARSVNVPGTGGCLYFAIHGCRTRRVRGDVMRTLPSHVKESSFYKTNVCAAYLEYLEHMASDGTLALAGLNRRYYGLGSPADRTAALKAIKAFIAGIQAADICKMTLQQWGGDEELFGLVWYVREPVFVITETKDLSTSVRILRLVRPDPSGPEHIHEQVPDASEAYAILRTLLRHRVIPTVLLHVTLPSGQGHFKSIRFNERIYSEWHKGDPDGTRGLMRERLQAALMSLGWYAPPMDATGIPLHAVGPVYRDSRSDSTYSPSDPPSPSHSAQEPMPYVAPHTRFELYRCLNPRRRRRSALAAAWEQAEYHNLIAYRDWDSAQVDPATRSEADTVEAGCQYWSRSPDSLLALLRALPYPEVAMALMSPATLSRLGSELLHRNGCPATPSFLRGESQDQVDREWARLAAVATVVSTAESDESAPIRWLLDHPSDAREALHALRLHDWNMVARVVQACDQAELSRAPAQPQERGGQL